MPNELDQGYIDEMNRQGLEIKYLSTGDIDPV